MWRRSEKDLSVEEHYNRKQGTRDKVDLNYYTAAKELYDIPYYTPRLLEIYKERNVPINLNVRVKGVDTSAKQVHFEKIETVGDQKVYTPLFKTTISCISHRLCWPPFRKRSRAGLDRR